MRKTKRSAFTIVELVIVIAVIAVLSAVLIPTFGSIIESANKAVDTQLVAQINTILAVEDILGGGVNDAVEIQKVIKEHGLKLQTKSKGQYIWYDIENKKAVLAGLNETGIALDGADAEPTASANVNGPVLLSEVDDTETAVPKGHYKTPISPESFVEGYLFLSTESADGLAEAIHALRNPEGESEGEVKASLEGALAKLDKIAGAAKVAALMHDFMSRTAILTEYGTIFVGTNAASVTKILVSSSTDTLTADALNGLATTYPQLYVIDLHSDVVDIEDVSKVVEAGDIDAETGKVNGIYFVYCNDEIKEFDKDPAYNGNIKNLITVDERNQYITELVVVRVYLDKSGNPVVDANGNRVQDSTGLGHEYPTESHKVLYDFRHLTYNTVDKAYEFKTYSFDISGNPGIAVGTENCFLTEDEQLKINSGVLTLYAIFEEVDADFKIGNLCYSSAQVTRKLAKGEITSGTITVVSTSATLGDDTYKEITIPSGVTLHLPYYTDVANKVYSTSTAAKTGRSMNNTDPGNNINKLDIDGHTNLTIPSDITLNNEGTIYVDAVLYGASGKLNQCYVRDDCGVLVVNGTLNIGDSDSTGTLYAYGVVRGSGEIIANKGTVTEIFTVLDWGGGTHATNAMGENVAPFHNWSVDNIRANMTINTGVKYSAFGSVYVLANREIDFVLVDSTANSEPLFVMAENTAMQKTYDEGFNLAILEGTVTDNQKMIDIASLATVDFRTTALPLPNFDITVNEGATLNLNNNVYQVLPGSDITVNGTLNVNTRIVILDSYDLGITKAPIAGEARGDCDAKMRDYTRYGLTKDGKCIAYKFEQMEVSGFLGLTKSWTDVTTVPEYNDNSGNYFDNDNSDTTSVPSHALSANSSATFTVNGTLNFGEGAAFAGKILSNTNGATISVASGVTVTGFLIPNGFTAGDSWHHTAVKGQTPAVELDGTLHTSLSGTWIYSSVSQGNVTITGWQSQN